MTESKNPDQTGDGCSENESRALASADTEVHQLCEDFEDAWRKGNRVKIEEFLAGSPRAFESALLQHLLTVELNFRKRRGDQPILQEYKDRFPAHAAVVEAAFAGSQIDAEAPAVATERPVADVEIPERIGRYRVERILGKGGFGSVVLAQDEKLDRLVAVKVPHRHLIAALEDVDLYLAEARAVAKLDHPGIVPVHDVGRTDDGLCYIVSKFIEGSDLATRIKESPPPRAESARLVADVAEALHHSHLRGLVHRDIKPANILLDGSGKPYVVDFGLALKEEDFGQRAAIAGTPGYMSPEQARGEAHRVDGRADIFSLGVVLYELLTGQRPFHADRQLELLEQITTSEARPLRQRDDTIPKELERICLKALSKRMSDRYTTALDFADDLRHFLDEVPGDVKADEKTAPVPSSTVTPSDTPPPLQDVTKAGIAPPVGDSSEPINIVPKGLRSFDAEDADFFLELLPGPRDRDGLPDSIRFWKTRIEELDSEQTFSVGLIYGPSGCGKSSLVKAGLLPRLADHVTAVYVEATADDTETRLLSRLRKHCTGLREDVSLKEALASLRRGEGLPGETKVLLVLDQFEQWLHARRDDEDTELLQALRQCDGGRVQCVLLVRDDFWMAVTRFFDDLEIGLIKGDNVAAVDLFDARHARRVLVAFGRAYGSLPEGYGQTTDEQRQFLDQAVSGLMEEGKAVCVRLALFAEMVKGKTWTPATLRDIGGAAGIGVTFLEETFSSDAAVPKHRLHQKAARAVLNALMPEMGTDIKGCMRSSDGLRDASGYADRQREFGELLHILDSELRLITPTDPESVEADEEPPADVGPEGKYYQLTHDYLVPSLREWLTRKQKETRRGRAELRLAERSALWNVKPENRLLPAWWEYLNIRLLTNKQSWTEPQRRMMDKAGRFHGLRWGVALLLLVGITVGGQWYLAIQREREERMVQDNNQKRAESLVEAVLTAPPDAVPYAIQNLSVLREYAEPILRTRFDDASLEVTQRLHVAYALAEFDTFDFAFPFAGLKDASPGECPNVVRALQDAPNAWLSALDGHNKTANANKDWPFKARLVIVALHLGSLSPTADMLEFENRPDPIQRTVFIETFVNWHGDLEQLKQHITETEHTALLSGISLAVGSVEGIVPTAQAEWESLLTDWYSSQPDGGTHSAAGWALRKWNGTEPPIDDARVRGKERGWIVTDQTGLAMIRIPAGQFERSVHQFERRIGRGNEKKRQVFQITQDFLLSDREITIGLFRQFVDDEEYEGEKPKWEGEHKFPGATTAHPVQEVNWYDAVMFCNWLSWKEDLTPCYVLSDRRKDEFGREECEVEIIIGADGFRLPTEAEWEYACRAGTTTQFSFGDDEVFLARYGIYMLNSNAQAARVGTRLCNAWGLFDMHGNVREWCWDSWGDFGAEVRDTDGSYRVYRDGCWGDGAWICQSSFRNRWEPAHRVGAQGFRVASVPSRK